MNDRLSAFLPAGPPPSTKLALPWAGRTMRAAGLLVVGIGLTVMLGWIAGIAPLVSLAPPWPAMSMLTALSITLLGAALLASGRGAELAAVVAVLASLRLAAYLIGWNPGVDTLGLADPRGHDAVPASMSPGTALTLLLLAAALLMARRPSPNIPFQTLTMLALLIAWLGISRYIFGGEPLLPIARMALHTAFCLLILGLGALCARSDLGIVALLASPGAGGSIARRLLAPALLLPPAAGWLRVQGTQAGWYGAEAGLTLLTAALATAFGGLVWASAYLLERSDRERRQQAERVLASQQELQAILESALDAVVTIDSAGVVTGWNARAEATFGWTPRQAVGQSLDGLIVPAHQRQSHREGLARYLATGHSTLLNRRIEMTALHRDGHEVPIDLSIAAIRTGGELRFSAFVRDISERKQAEAARRRLAAIVESSEDPIISKTLDGRIASWNRGAEKFFGYSEEEVLGQPVLMLVPERLAAEETRLLEQVRTQRQLTRFDAVRRRKDGTEVEVSVQLSPILDESGEVVGESSITRDITEIKRHAAELQRSNAELEQFAYVASHDLQEPLRMVANYTELLAKRYQGQLDEKADKYIHYASDGARRMQRLVADLLAFSRVGSQGQPLVPTSSQRALQLALDSLQRVLRESGATVEFDGLPTVVADEGQLHQLFQNLIGNAVKFCSDAVPHIVVKAVPAGKYWQFSVADNGIGIEMRFAERIFQMFQRLHEIGRYEGSGIGLAIAKRIVERHGGRIWVDSTPGAGTTFHFTLAEVPKGAA